MYPVILYSHGIGLGWASGNTTLVEGLVSNGYIVVGINHAFIGSMSLFPDGRTVTFDEATSAAMNEPPPAQMAELQAMVDASDDWREHIALYAQAMELMPNPLKHVTQALATQVADQQFVLGHLAQMQRTNAQPVAAHFDLQRVGIMGMSLGGSAAIETCSMDERCKAGVNLDGFHPRHIDLALERAPFLFLNRADNLLFRTNFESAASPVYAAMIPDATHFNFFDFSIMSPLYRELGILGPIDGERMLDIIESFALWFFDKHLKAKPVDLAAQAKTYPEVEFGQRNVQ